MYDYKQGQGRTVAGDQALALSLVRLCLILVPILYSDPSLTLAFLHGLTMGWHEGGGKVGSGEGDDGG